MSEPNGFLLPVALNRLRENFVGNLECTLIYNEWLEPLHWRSAWTLGDVVPETYGQGRRTARKSVLKTSKANKGLCLQAAISVVRRHRRLVPTDGRCSATKVHILIPPPPRGPGLLRPRDE